MSLITTKELPKRVTRTLIESKISRVEYLRRPYDTTLTLCFITMDNGITVSGMSACVDQSEYQEHIGQKIAFENAFDQLWPMFGFLLAECRMVNEEAAQEQYSMPPGEMVTHD